MSGYRRQTTVRQAHVTGPLYAEYDTSARLHREVHSTHYNIILYLMANSASIVKLHVTATQC